MTERYYNLIGAAEYARLYHVSARTARRRLAAMPGAVHSTGNRWVAPVLSTDYSKLSGISVKTARKRGIKAATPSNATSSLKGTLKQRAAINLFQILQNRATTKPANWQTIIDRLGHANRRQLNNVASMTALQPSDIFDTEYEGDDGVSILFYH